MGKKSKVKIKKGSVMYHYIELRKFFNDRSEFPASVKIGLCKQLLLDAQQMLKEIGYGTK